MKVAFLYPERLGTESAPGSNAWAVSGEHTASGKAMLASDPHMEFSLPSPWYLVHLTAPGLNVTGASLAGVPAVVIGHNDRIAWGVTNLEFDMQDLYSERVDAQSGTYVYQGRIQAARLEREAIPVKGAAPVDLLTMSTRHGPLILNDDNQTYSLRWMPGELTGMDFPLLALNRAGNWEEFNNALRRFSGPAQNFIYADVDGNIGHHVAGPVPLRGTCSGDVPNDGPSGTCEWNGTIPYDDLPQVYNPPSGIIVSANQNPFPANYKHPVSGVFAPPYRARQIRARLKAKEKLAIPDMLSIQKDVYSSPLNFISKQMDWAWKARAASNLPSREAVAFLRAWDGQMESGPAPVIAALLYEEVRKSAAKSAAPDAAAEYGSRMAPSVIERLLKERPNDWFKEGYDDMMVNALASAISRGTELFGSSISRWDWGRFSRAELRHGVLGGLPLLGRYVNIGPAPMSGSAHSVKQITDRLAPSFRMVVDFADFDASVANVTTGQSGQVFSPHYKDQWPAYYNGTGLPMQFQKVTAIETLVVAP